MATSLSLSRFVLLALPVLCLYFPFLNTDFYAEDHPTVLKLSEASWRNPLGIYLAEGADFFAGTPFQGFDTHAADYFRPVLPFVMFLVQKAAPFEPWAFRIVNLLVHVTSGWLLYLVALRWGCRPGAALFAAYLFLLHPGRSYPLLRIVTLSTLLAGFFTLLSLLAFTAALEAPARRRGLLPALSATFLALLSKETAFFFPLFLLVWLRARRRAAWIFWLLSAWLAYMALRFAFGATFVSVHTCLPYVVRAFDAYYFVNYLVHFSTLVTYTPFFYWPPDDMINWQAYFPQAPSLPLNVAEVAAFLVLWRWLKRKKRSPEVSLVPLGLLFSLGPAALTIPSLTELYYPAIWLSLLAAITIEQVLADHPVTSRPVRLLVFGGVCGWLVLAGGHTYLNNHLYRAKLASGAERVHRELLPLLQGNPSRLFLINVPENWALGLRGALVHRLGDAAPAVYVLSVSPQDDTAPAQVEIVDGAVRVTKTTGFFRTHIERTTLCLRRPSAGEVYRTADFTVSLLPGRSGRTLEIRLDEPISDGDLLVVWNVAAGTAEPVAP